MSMSGRKKDISTQMPLLRGLERWNHPFYRDAAPTGLLRLFRELRSPHLHIDPYIEPTLEKLVLDVAGRIGDTCFFKAFFSEQTAIASAACPAFGIWIVAT